MEKLFGTPIEKKEEKTKNLLFLCYECKCRIPYITQVIISNQKLIIKGCCGCGYYFEEEMSDFFKKVYLNPLIEKNKLIFPEYYKCKKHNKNLKAFCHDCLNLVCEDCMKEISHNTNYLEDEEYELEKDFVSTFNKKQKIILIYSQN